MTRPFIIQLVILSAILLSIILFPNKVQLILLISLLPIVIINILDTTIGSGSNLLFGTIYIFKIKRVYTDYGKFYLILRNGNIYLYQDKLFYLKHHDSTHYSTLDYLKKWTKSKCDEITKNERRKGESLKSFNNWNGSVDLRSDRDRKLEKIL